MVEALGPQTIINHGRTPDDIFGEYAKAGLEIITIPHHAVTVKKAVR